jgi:hypothetical protein
MLITLKNGILGWGGSLVIASLCTFAQSGCSDSSSAPSGGDASTADVQADVEIDGMAEAGPPPPLGVPVATCEGCPVCGGVLGSATTGISYCTKTCTATADCPAGTACVMNTTSATLLDMQCIKTCTSSADCTAPFICRSDLLTPGSYCWSPFPAPLSGAGMDAAAPDSGLADTGAPPEDTGASSEAGAAPDGGPDAADAADGT